MKKICPTCKREYRSIENFCTKCGIELVKEENIMEEDKRKTYEDTISDLIQDVRNAGEYLENNAEDLVCKAPRLAEDGFNIWLRFNSMEIPRIEVTQELLVVKKR
jgi:hypothetical protein